MEKSGPRYSEITEPPKPLETYREADKEDSDNRNKLRESQATLDKALGEIHAHNQRNLKVLPRTRHLLAQLEEGSAGWRGEGQASTGILRMAVLRPGRAFPFLLDGDGQRQVCLHGCGATFQALELCTEAVQELAPGLDAVLERLLLSLVDGGRDDVRVSRRAETMIF